MEVSALSNDIRATELSRRPTEGPLKTDQRVLARITEGIYRQPASALRELVSNAYDADATEVIILSDAPRFEHISVRDNGRGLSPEVLTQLVEHIGGSAKRTEKGKDLHITSSTDVNISPGGRRLIGKLGIGLFSVAQFTRHFLIITKTSGDQFRTVADITLGNNKDLDSSDEVYETGHYRIWRERSADASSHGTEIKLLDLLPRTRDELASNDLWTKQDEQAADPDAEKIPAPVIHIGRVSKNSDNLSIHPSLPWAESDGPREKFEKLVGKIKSLTTSRESVDLRKVADNYIWTMWSLALSAPVSYVEDHPFDLLNNDEYRFFGIENRIKGQARELQIPKNKSPRDALGLTAPDGVARGTFDVFMDNVQLLRPILFHDLPKTTAAVKTPLLFIGAHRQEFGNKPRQLTGGPLQFEAYLFWSPRIVPKQHQGVMIRVGNAAGALFDPDFMGYETSELTRKSQVTAEIFVTEGLDDAINIDRESFNYAHPHFQFLTKWLHSAFRQFSNRHKDLGKVLRNERLTTASTRATEKVASLVQTALDSRGIEDVPEVVILDSSATQTHSAAQLRREGKIVLNKTTILPIAAGTRLSDRDLSRQKFAEKKASAIMQLLHGLRLLDSLSYDDQEKLIRDIMEIVLLDENT